jgi:transposase
MTKPRKHYLAVEKVAILRRHLIERVPVSNLCDQYRIQPSMFYNWQKQFFENGAGAFEQPRSAQRSTKSDESLLFKTNFSERTRSWPSCWRSTSS